MPQDSESEPSEAERLYQEGERLRRSGREDLALSAFRRAAKLGHGSALFQIASACINDGDYESASRYLLLSAEAGCIPAYANLGWIEASRGNEQDAEAYYLRAIEGGVYDAAYLLAELHERESRESEAAKWFRVAAENGDSGGMIKLASIALRSDRRLEAIEWLEKAANADDADALVGLAGIMLNDGDENRAEALYLRAIELGSGAAYFGLSRIRTKSGDIDAAELLCERAVELGHEDAFVSLAWMKEVRRDSDGAQILYRRAADHGDVYAMRRLGELARVQGEVPEAMKWYERALSAGEDDVAAEITSLIDATAWADGMSGKIAMEGFGWNVIRAAGETRLWARSGFLVALKVVMGPLVFPEWSELEVAKEFRSGFHALGRDNELLSEDDSVIGDFLKKDAAMHSVELDEVNGQRRIVISFGELNSWDEVSEVAVIVVGSVCSAVFRILTSGHPEALVKSVNWMSQQEGMRVLALQTPRSGKDDKGDSRNRVSEFWSEMVDRLGVLDELAVIR